MSRVRNVMSLTFDDVLLRPNKSNIMSRKDVSLETQFSRNIRLKRPIVSSNMDTVTEYSMAITMAKNGGIGIIHRYLSIEEQVEQVLTVKRAEGFIIKYPYSIDENDTVEHLKKLPSKSVLVTRHGKLTGIVTNRDVRFTTKKQISEIMTRLDQLKYMKKEPSLITTEEAKNFLYENRIEKFPIVDENYYILGLITAKDLYHYLNNPYSTRDKTHRLMVGAAIGVKENDIDRALALKEAGVDCIVIDIAHGHSDLVLNQLKRLKKLMDIDIIAGNVATAEGAVELADNGADAIKIGIGPGSICTTRIVTGCGVPQLSAILEISEALKNYHIPLIADGGIKNSGDMTKALAAGANSVMLGSLLAGTDESPGRILIKDGRKVKIVRGMAGYGANISNKEKNRQDTNISEMVPEGVEGQVPYRGSVKEILQQLCGGVSSGISYCGSTTIPEMQSKAQFIRVSGVSLKESGTRVDLI